MDKINCKPRKIKDCANCQQKGAFQSKPSIPYIEKTTNLRLVSETDVLTVRDVLQEEIEEPKPLSIQCLCSNPSSKLSSTTTNSIKNLRLKSNQNKSNKKDDRKNKVVFPVNNDTAAQRMFDNYRKQRRAIIEIIAKVKKNQRPAAAASRCDIIFQLEKPKWFHKLSPDQVYFLEYFSTAVRNDIVEGHCTGTQSLLTQMGMCPVPSCKKIMIALKNCEYNVIRFMETLVKLIAQKGFEEPSDKYTWNCKLLMSCICHLEMPVLLRWLYVRLPPLPYEATLDVQPTLGNPKCAKVNKNVSPYLLPVCHQIIDWTETRSIYNENLKNKRYNLQCVRIPPIIFEYCPYHVNLAWVFDYKMQLPPYVKEKAVEIVTEYEPPPPPAKVCLFVGKTIDLSIPESEPEEGLYEIQGSFKSVSEERNETVGELLEEDNESLNIQGENVTFSKFPPEKIRTLFEEESLLMENEYNDYFPERKYLEAPLYKDSIPKLLSSTLNQYRNYGLTCVQFPKIEKHPDIIQMIKFLRREKITKKKKEILFREMETLIGCLTTMPMDTRLPIFETFKLLENKEQLTYLILKKMRILANKEHQKYFIRCWNDRYVNTQDLWISLQPVYFSSNRFWHIFYAYLQSGYNGINFWPKNFKVM